MTETVPAEGYRFNINPETLNKFKSLREKFEALQKKYPYLSGLGFFGSNTKGTYNQNSDFDVCIFYNSERITSLGTSTSEEWDEIISQLNRPLGSAFDQRIYSRSDGFRIDISADHTENSLEFFIEAANEIDEHTDEEDALDKIDFASRDLCARFFLAIGDEVYMNRKYVLEKLRSQVEGEKYIRLLMKSLANFEQVNKDSSRVAPHFNGYPTTYDEAVTYFKIPK